MEVRVNDNPIDVRLENETNAREVLQQLDSWLLGEGFFISSVLVNETATTPSDTVFLEACKVDEIHQINIVALPLDEMAYERFSTLLNFFSYFLHGVNSGEHKLISDLHKELPHILDSIDYILGLRVGSKPVSEALKNLFEEFTLTENDYFCPENLKAFLANLCFYIESRIREIANPLLELKSGISLIETQIPILEEIPLLLQTGKEREAMEKVIAFSEIHEKLTRIFSLLRDENREEIFGLSIDGSSFMEFFKNLNLHFQELTEAMESEDTILIGDLLEYEIAPKIEMLTTVLNTLPSLAGSSS